jgi:hypothetical protein
VQAAAGIVACARTASCVTLRVTIGSVTAQRYRFFVSNAYGARHQALLCQPSCHLDDGHLVTIEQADQTIADQLLGLSQNITVTCRRSPTASATGEAVGVAAELVLPQQVEIPRSRHYAMARSRQQRPRRQRCCRAHFTSSGREACYSWNCRTRRCRNALYRKGSCRRGKGSTGNLPITQRGICTLPKAVSRRWVHVTH